MPYLWLLSEHNLMHCFCHVSRSMKGSCAIQYLTDLSLSVRPVTSTALIIIHLMMAIDSEHNVVFERSWYQRWSISQNSYASPLPTSQVVLTLTRLLLTLVTCAHMWQTFGSVSKFTCSTCLSLRSTPKQSAYWCVIPSWLIPTIPTIHRRHMLIYTIIS